MSAEKRWTTDPTWAPVKGASGHAMDAADSVRRALERRLPNVTERVAEAIRPHLEDAFAAGARLGKAKALALTEQRVQEHIEKAMRFPMEPPPCPDCSRGIRGKQDCGSCGGTGKWVKR